MLACLFSALSAGPSLTGCGKSGGPFAIAPLPQGGFSLDYGRRELPGSDMAAPRVSGLLPASPLHDALPQLVKIQSTESMLGIPIARNCLLSQAPFFYEREKGLRLAYCPPGELEERIRELLRAARDRRDNPSPPDTRLEIHADKFAMGIAALPRLREVIGAGVLVSVDAGLPGERPLQGDFRGSSRHFKTGPRSPDQINGDSPPALGRVFPGSAFHLLIRNERILLLYELNSRELLFVSLEPGALPAEEIADALEAIQNELDSAARNASPLLTEIYFGDQGPRSAAYVELGTPGDESIRARLRLRGHANLELELFLFGGGTVLLPGAVPGPRDELIMEGDDGTRRVFRLEDYRARRAGPGRSLTLHRGDLRNNSMKLGPARFSRGREIAGNPGLHPRFARPEYLSTSETPCGVADFRLTEWNPFGLREADGRVLTGGKFLELRLERTCRNESILFFAGDVVLEPGNRLFQRDEILLFVADGAYFERRNILENSRLRGLRGDARIRILDTAGAPGEHSGTVMREPVPNAIYFSGALNSPHLARVHSLIPSSPSMEVFHGAGARGLRGDLAPHHAMSPGFAHPAEKPSIEKGRLRFSEILPRGSRDADGRSIATDEFLELRAGPHGGRLAGAYRLRITPASGVERLYIFPSPRTEESFAHPVFARNDSVCFNYGEGLVPVSGLSLPNGAARYTLRDARGGLVDELHMDDALQGRLDDALRVSYTRAFDHIWRPSHGPAAESPRCPLTRATPGRESAFAAFVAPLPGPEPKFRYHGFVPARLRIRGGNRPDAFQDLSEVQVAPGDAFSAPSMTNYHLLEIADADGGPVLFAGQYYGTTPELIIAGVSSRPTAGRFEWIRLCSPGGFTGDSPAGSLFIRDENSADRIIPWNHRRPVALLPPGLTGDALRLNPGECALVIDPDFAGGDLLIDNRDRVLWTIASGSALGNGLASGESLRLYHDSPAGEITMASMGLPGTTLPWSMYVNTGEYLRRIPGTERDTRENFEIAIIE